jgi:hypothetical protein
MLGLDDSVAIDMPYCVSDVTVAIRFALEKQGLLLEKMKTKENLLGFFNPIPPFKNEHDHPVLCLIYKKPIEQGQDTIYVKYFNDDEEVKIVVEDQE